MLILGREFGIWCWVLRRDTSLTIWATWQTELGPRRRKRLWWRQGRVWWHVSCFLVIPDKGTFLCTPGNSMLSYWLVQREKSEVRQTVFRLKISLLGLQDLWKGLFVAREVRGWCHECQFLHHEGRRVSSKSPEWCKNWHEWHHPLTSSATKSPFQRSRRPKRNWFSAEKQFAATEDFSRCSNQHDRMFFHIG